MGRLIDANKLNTEFDEILTALKSGMGKESITREEFAEAIEILKGCVDEQPTAYDVSKVVAELEHPNNYTIVAGHHYTTVDRAIDIVKRGGAE